MRDPSASAATGLREILTGAAIRSIAQIRDWGESFLAKMKNADGGDLVDTGDDKKDFWVHYVDELTGHSGLARLFIPGNILFARPTEDDTVMIVRGRDAHGPGNAYALHGDAGTADRVPDWATASSDDDVKDGLYSKRTLRIESKEKDVEIVTVASGKTVKIIAGDTTITVNKDGDVEIVPHSGNVVSVGDTAGNTKKIIGDGEALHTWAESVDTLLNSVKEQLNNLRTDLQTTSMCEGEAVFVAGMSAQQVTDSLESLPDLSTKVKAI